MWSTFSLSRMKEKNGQPNTIALLTIIFGLGKCGGSKYI